MSPAIDCRKSSSCCVRRHLRSAPQREEEKIWRDLEEVRRQAAKIEDGRARAMEKRMALKQVRGGWAAGARPVQADLVT